MVQLNTTETDVLLAQDTKEAFSEARKIYARLRYKLNTSGVPLLILPFKQIGSLASTNFKTILVAGEEVELSKKEENWVRVYLSLAHELGHLKYHPGSIRRWYKLQKAVESILGVNETAARAFNIYSDTLTNYTLLYNVHVRDDYETGGYIKGMVLDFGLEVDKFLVEIARYFHFKKKKSKKEIIEMFPRIKNIIWRPDPMYWDVVEGIDNILEIKPSQHEKYAWSLSPWVGTEWILHCYLQYMAYVELEKEDLKDFLEKEDVLIWFKKLLGVDIQKDLLDLFNKIHHYRDFGYTTEDDPLLLKEIMTLIFKYFNIFPQSFDGVNKGIIQCPKCKYVDSDVKFGKDLKCDVSSFPNIKIMFSCPKCKERFTLVRIFNYQKGKYRCIVCGEYNQEKLKVTYSPYPPNFYANILCDSCTEKTTFYFSGIRGIQCPYCLGRDTSASNNYVSITKIKDVIPPPPDFDFYATFYCNNCEEPDGETLRIPISEITKRTEEEYYIFEWW